MKKAEIILSILAILAFGLDLMLVLGGTMFTTFILLILSLLYLFLGFALLNKIKLRKIFQKESYKGIGVLRILSAIIIGYTLSTVVIGVLFGLLTLPGAKVLEIVGLCVLSFFSILLLIEYFINKSDFYKSTLPRMVIWGGLCLFLYFLPQTRILEFKYRNYPEFVEAMKNSMADPTNEQLRQKMEQERRKTY